MGSVKAGYECIKAFSETDFTEDLKAIDVPVLVIHSEDDQIVPYADSAPLTVKLLKNGTLKTYKDLPHGCQRPIRTSSMPTFWPSSAASRSACKREEAPATYVCRGRCPAPNDRPIAADTYATRGAQMFPRFTDDEIARLSRFGEPRSYKQGDMLAQVGEAGPGLMLILSGQVEVTQRDGDRHKHIVTHERGNFMGELAQLSGRPYLVDEQALTDVQTMAIPPDRLRALLIAEAELGERIMRALILRRVGLIESGAGPIVIGDEQNADVLRLVNFLRRNGHPLPAARSPGTTAARRPWSSASKSRPRNCRSCSVRAGNCCAIRRRDSSPAASAWSGRSTATSSSMSS